MSTPTLYLQELEPGTASFREAVELRRTVFRETLGVDPGAAQTEAGTTHYAVCSDRDNSVIGSFIMEPRGLLAQVAVASEQRGLGVGSFILESAEGIARVEGWPKLSLYAHQGSRSFYRQHGFETIGRQFEAEGIPHIRMEKKLEEARG